MAGHELNPLQQCDFDINYNYVPLCAYFWVGVHEITDEYHYELDIKGQFVNNASAWTGTSEIPRESKATFHSIAYMDGG